MIDLETLRNNLNNNDKLKGYNIDGDIYNKRFNKGFRILKNNWKSEDLIVNSEERKMELHFEVTSDNFIRLDYHFFPYNPNEASHLTEEEIAKGFVERKIKIGKQFKKLYENKIEIEDVKFHRDFRKNYNFIIKKKFDSDNLDNAEKNIIKFINRISELIDGNIPTMLLKLDKKFLEINNN